MYETKLAGWGRERVVYKSIIQFPQNMLISHVFNYSTWHGIRGEKKSQPCYVYFKFSRINLWIIFLTFSSTLTERKCNSSMMTYTQIKLGSNIRHQKMRAPGARTIRGKKVAAAGSPLKMRVRARVRCGLYCVYHRHARLSSSFFQSIPYSREGESDELLLIWPGTHREG